MTTLTVQEASQSLGEWLRRAFDGERIAIHEGERTVLLQPLPVGFQETEHYSAREALRRLQSSSRVTAAQAGEFLREVNAERKFEPGN